MKKPGFWRLFCAYFVDLIILLCFSVLWLGCWKSLRSSYGWWGSVSDLTFDFVWVVGILGYFVLCERKGNGSLGKKSVHLKIQATSPAGLRCLGAYAIDFVLLKLLGWGFYVTRIYFLKSLLSQVDPVERKMIEVGVWLESGLVILVLFLLYFSILEHFFGKTLGKKLMGLQVVQEEKGE